MRGGRATSLSLAALLLAALLAGCGEEKKEGALDLPDDTSPTTDATAPFSMPSAGDPIDGDVAPRPADEKTAQGAGLFAAWTLSLLMHTPREAASTDLWLDTAAAGCEPCRTSASAWEEQGDRGQVFTYEGVPTFAGTTVKAQRQGQGWFVQYDVAVPKGTLRKGTEVLQATGAERLGYTFTMTWAEDRWQLDDFHVLG